MTSGECWGFKRGWKHVTAVLLFVLGLAVGLMPIAVVSAAGVIPIPVQDTWYNDNVNDVNCDGVVLQAKWYHETEDTETLHVAVSISVYGESPFGWGIRHLDGIVWFYADFDRDGKAEWRLEYDKVVAKYVTWCNAYNDIRKGR